MSEETPTSPEELEDLLKPALREGDAFLVRRSKDSVRISPAPEEIPHARSELQRTHPELYGYLLTISQRITDSSGCGLMVMLIVPVLALCFAIQGKAFHGMFAEDASTQRILDHLASWWIYVILGALGIGAYTVVQDRLERTVYLSRREDLRARLAGARLPVFEILALMEGDEGLATLSKHMKSDEELAESVY